MKKIKRLKCLLMLTLICGMMITALPAEVFATESVPSTQPVPATRTYKVRHVRQSLDGSYKDPAMMEYETLTGSVGQMTEASGNKTYEGFQALTPEQVEIAPSGDITVTVYYARKEFTTYFKTGDPDQDFYETFLYGTNQSTPAKPNIPGKIFTHWEYADEAGVSHTWTPGVQPGKDMTVYAQYDIPFQASYTVNYWYQNATDELTFTDNQKTYSLFDVETKVQNVNTAVLYDTTNRDTTYRKYNSAKTTAANMGKTVAGDGSTVVNVYYDRPVMTITLVYYDTTTGIEDHREDYRGIYGHSTDGIVSLDRKYRWTTPTNPHSGRVNIPGEFIKIPSFMIDDYNQEYHARILAKPPKTKIFTVYHYQNPDGTWTRDMQTEKKQFSTYDYKNFYIYFSKNNAHEAKFYYWTNSAEDFTTDVSASNPDLNAYTNEAHIDVLKNEQPINDYDGDGETYLHVYVTSLQYKLHFINADNNPVSLHYGAPLSYANTELSNPIKPANIPSHYVFAGWYTTARMDEATKLDPNNKMGEEDIFIYAKWEEPHIKVTVEGNGATSALPSVIDIPMMGSVHKELPTIPSKTGYWFAGWFKDAAFTQHFDVNESLAQDTTIYAKWIGRPQAKWEIRYVDEAGRVLANATQGEENLYSVLFATARGIPDYAADYAHKNLTLETDTDTNVLTFVYSKVRTYWITEDNQNLKDPEYGTKGPEKFAGYTFVKTNTASNGDTFHIYRKYVPNTGDGSNIKLYGIILGASVLGIIFIVVTKKKKD